MKGWWYVRLQCRQSNKLRSVLRYGLAVAVSVSCLTPPNAFAQSNVRPQETAGVESGNIGGQASQTSSSGDSANAEILHELEQMRARIQELESKLRQQSGTEPTAAESNRQAAHSQELVSATAPGTQTAAEQPASSKPAKAEPFAFADFTWLNGTARTKTPAFDSKFFTPEIRADVDYIYDFNSPKDDTIGGSSEVFRSDEFQLTQLGVGGDFHYDNVQARLMTQFGMY